MHECRMCGTAPVLDIRGAHKWAFVCEDCGYSTESYSTKDGAAKAWNSANDPHPYTGEDGA